MALICLRFAASWHLLCQLIRAGFVGLFFWFIHSFSS